MTGATVVAGIGWPLPAEGTLERLLVNDGVGSQSVCTTNRRADGVGIGRIPSLPSHASFAQGGEAKTLPQLREEKLAAPGRASFYIRSLSTGIGAAAVSASLGIC